jgi:hypothetical protein
LKSGSAIYNNYPIFIFLKYYGNQIPKLSWVLALQPLPPQHPMSAEILEASYIMTKTKDQEMTTSRLPVLSAYENGRHYTYTDMG